jgi:DNA-binding NtrC family response regulator
MDTVLVVDVSEDVRNFLRRALTYKNAQIHVLEATSVAAARHILQSRTVSYIITNYMLPDDSGLDILALTQSEHRYIPVIGMSSTDASDDMLSAGAVAFIRKPFTLSSLFEAIQHAATSAPAYNDRTVTW